MLQATVRMLLWLFVVIAFATTSYAQESPSAAAGQAVEELDRWLGAGSRAEGWRKHLRLVELRAEIARGDAADATKVASILKRFEGSDAGLQLPQFVRVRKALADWQGKSALAPIEQLPELARQAKQSYAPVTAADVARAKGKLDRAVVELNQYLGHGAAARGWRKYLELDALDAQLRPDAKASDESLTKVLKLLRTDQKGLERTKFTNLAVALQEYMAKSSQANNPNARADYDAKLDNLATNIEAYQKEPTGETLRKIGADLDWLQWRGQALRMVDVARRHLSQPNLVLVVRGEFLAAGMNRDINEVGPVRDVIMGTNIVGSGRTNATVKFHTIPDPNKAVLEARLHGTNSSRTTGYNGPAIIWSSGTTQLSAAKRVTIDQDGVHGATAKAEAKTSSNITGIGSSKRGVVGCFVEKIATKKAGEQKGQAEAIASRHASEKLREKFDEQVGRELAKTNREFQEKLRNPMVRRGQLPSMNFSTTSDELKMVLLQATGAQLGSQAPPPAMSGQPHLSLRLHDSVVNNIAGSMLAGQTMGQKEMELAAKNWLGEVPDRLKDDAGKEPWSITFAEEDPITFTVDDGGFVLTGRGSRYTSGERAFGAMNFTVRYKIEKFDKGVKGVRQGDIEILPPGFEPGKSRPLSLRQTTLRSLMTRRLSKMFEPEIVKDEPMPLKGEWKAAGPLSVSELAADNGWLAVGWVPDRPAANVARRSDVAMSTIEERP